MWFWTVKHPLEFIQQLGELLGKRGVIGKNWEGEDIHPHPLRDPVRSGIVQFLWHLPPSRYEVAPLILRNGRDTTNSKLISCSQYSINCILRVLIANYISLLYSLNLSLYLTMLILPVFMRMRTHNRKEKRSLCFSNSERQTLLYRL